MAMRRRDLLSLAAGATASPLAALAQQRAVPMIGYLGVGTESGVAVAFRNGLGELGYVEGRNLEIVYRYAERARLPAAYAELVRLGAAVIFTNAPASIASSNVTIPVVFAANNDPVETGLVANLNRPGGNTTGAYFLGQALIAKRLELLHELVPAVVTIGVLIDPDNPSTEAQVDQAEAAARVLGMSLLVLNARTPSEIESVFVMLSEQRIGALLVAAQSLFFQQRSQVAALAAGHSVPAIYAEREFVEAGGLMNYGPNVFDAFRIAGTYVGRILKGEKPADLPVQQSTRIKMVLNLRTAKALGIEVPTATLLRATEVIE